MQIEQVGKILFFSIIFIGLALGLVNSTRASAYSWAVFMSIAIVKALAASLDGVVAENELHFFYNIYLFFLLLVGNYFLFKRMSEILKNKNSKFFKND